MPIYDYTCSTCRRVTEVIHGINDHGPKFCPECGAEGTMTKTFVAPTVHFKGSGWAKKDRSSSARSARANDEKGGGSGDAASSSGDGAASSSDGTPGAGGSSSGKDATTSDTRTSDKRQPERSSTGKSSSGASKPSSSPSD